MKILNRYIAKETTYVFAMAFIIFTFFLIMNSLFVMSDLVIKYGISLFNVIKLLLLLLPSTVAVTVPMAFLIGILLTYSRLVQDNEYTGMQASGISIRQISMPAIVLSLVLTLVMISFNNWVLPAANLSYKKLYYEIVRKRSTVIIQEHAFINEFDNYVFYIGGKDSKLDLLKNVIVFVKPKSGEKDPVKVILSREGELISDPDSFRIALKLKEGIIQVGSHFTPLSMSQIWFDTNYVDLDINGVLRSRQNPGDLKGSREMTIAELLDELRKGSGSTHDRNNLLVDLHAKFSIPFACVAFAFVAIPLGLMTKKGGKIMGISLSLALIFIYYVFLMYGQTEGYRGSLDHFLSVWLPNFVVMGIGACLFAYMVLPYLLNKIRKRND